MLDRIKLLVGRGDIVFTGHARQRMRQRGANERDVENGLLTATTCAWQDDHQTWHCEGGVDCDGDDIEVSVVIDADVVVVTVY